MDDRIFFSIVIPTFNRSFFLLKAIESCLAQTYPHYEIIVVDDGSTDDTEIDVRCLPSNRILYFKKENGERAVARNYGISKAKGDYITFLDSDDLLYPSYLSNGFESIKKFHLPPFFHLAYEVKNDKGQVVSKKDFMSSGDYKLLVRGNPLSCLGIFVKREVLANFQFNEDRKLIMVEDWELWIRLLANFGIKTDRRISAAMIYHKKRSLAEAEAEQLANAKQLAIQYAFKDNEVKKVYGKYKYQMIAFAESYVALHLAVGHYRKSALKYLQKSIAHYPLVILSKRFLVILKRLVF
jgi:glycosyltransferase involved in cell wall biosynthesis